jgi:hypothetical protein
MTFFIVHNHGDLFDGGNCEKVFFPRTATRGIYPRFGENPAINILLETVLIYATFYPRRKAPLTLLVLSQVPGTHYSLSACQLHLYYVISQNLAIIKDTAYCQ